MAGYTVYMHVAPNGKRYIGITCRKPEYRWNGGRGYDGSPHFSAAIMKYGWDNICHEILFSGMTKEDAICKEIELIARYNTTDRSYGYNITCGGEGSSGVKQSDKTKAKHVETMRQKMLVPDEKAKIMKCLALAHSNAEAQARRIDAIKRAHNTPEMRKEKSERYSGSGNPFYGKRHTDETKAIIREKRKSQVMTNGKPVVQLDENGCIMARFQSGIAASRETGITYQNINACLRGKINSAGGYCWCYEEVV